MRKRALAAFAAAIGAGVLASVALGVIERDSKRATLVYTRRFSVVPLQCVTATRHWRPAPRFRHSGRLVVTLRAVDKSNASSRFASRSLMWR
jgi:hypothetical protein